MNYLIKTGALALILGCASAANAADKSVTVTLNPQESAPVINKEIYGQFAEHLGTCIYGGIWVGEDSPIPNTNGYRNDVLQAMRDIKVPVLRWPGGCFADEYHWVDGIGLRRTVPAWSTTTGVELLRIIASEPMNSSTFANLSVPSLI